METNTKISALNEVIRSRRTIRSFYGEISDETLMKILESGIYAPFGGATGIPLKEIRKIFIFRQNTESMKVVRDIINARIKSSASRIGLLLKLMPFLRKKMQVFANRLKNLSENGIPGLTEGAFYIVIAEKSGFPPIEKQSLSHTMENIWLTATAYGLGFHLVSATAMLSKNKIFMKILGLNQGEWALDGCVIGVPKSMPPLREERKIENFITWIDYGSNTESA
jgi:nitroreductase